MTKIFCDRCGKEVDTSSIGFIERSNQFFGIQIATLDYDYQKVTTELDLCEDCIKGLEDWFNKENVKGDK